jgi:hypothetical protein
LFIQIILCSDGETAEGMFRHMPIIQANIVKPHLECVRKHHHIETLLLSGSGLTTEMLKQHGLEASKDVMLQPPPCYHTEHQIGVKSLQISDRNFEHLEKMKEFELQDKQNEREYQLKLLELKLKLNVVNELEKDIEPEKNQLSAMSNQKRVKQNSKSKYKGVTKTEYNYRADSCTSGLKKSGYFKKESHAAWQYNLWAKKYVGFDHVNLVPKEEIKDFEPYTEQIRDLPKNVYLNSLDNFIEKQYSDKRICRVFHDYDSTILCLELINSCSTGTEYLEKEKPLKPKGYNCYIIVL